MPHDFEDGILLVDEFGGGTDRILTVRDGLIRSLNLDTGVEQKYISIDSVQTSGLDASFLNGFTDDDFIKKSDIPDDEGFIRKIDDDTYVAHKTNLVAVSDPTAANDTNEGYRVGSIWINTATEDVFIATDVTSGAAVWANTTSAGADTDRVAVPVFLGRHTTNSTGYRTAGYAVIDFDRLPTGTPEFSWFQEAVPTNNASVRLRNVTDATNLFETTGISSTGIQTATVTLPGSGKKLILLQHKEDAFGAGRSRIQGGTLHVG